MVFKEHRCLDLEGVLTENGHLTLGVAGRTTGRETGIGKQLMDGQNNVKSGHTKDWQGHFTAQKNLNSHFHQT